jgi:RNA-directed DNA polymerase
LRFHKIRIYNFALGFECSRNTGASRGILETKVKPIVINFLKERGLELSEEKTRITSIHEGFDFLGFNVRKYNGKLLIKPSKQSIKAFLHKIRDIIRSNKAARTEMLIWQLNPMIVGWTNYYRHVVAKKAFEFIDYSIYQNLRRWIKRRHPNKTSVCYKGRNMIRNFWDFDRRFTWSECISNKSG